MFAETIPGPQGPSGLDILAQVLPFFVVALVIVIVVAFFVARAGGLPVAGALAGGAAAPRSGRGAGITAVVVIGTSILGLIVGREIAHDFSAGGWSGLGALLLLFLLIAVVVGLVLIGLVAIAFRHGFSRAIGRILASAGLLAVGAFIGDVTAVATGGAFPPPVFLVAKGAAQVHFEQASMPFVAHDGGPIECHSVQDGREVQEVTALDLGELGPGTLRATISIATYRSDDASVILFIDEGDLAAGSLQPAWEIGDLPVAQVEGGGTSGKVTFELSRNREVETSPSPPAALDWPVTLSGVMSWSCQPW